MAYDCNTIFNSKIICQCDIKMSQISQLKLQTRSKLNPSVEIFCYWLVDVFPKSSLFYTELIFFDQKSKKNTNRAIRCLFRLVIFYLTR